MTSGSSGKVTKVLQTLFTSGRVGELADGALLDRFLATRDEAAFEVLVERHGPMVLRVCRAKLADPAGVDDAFQAVFLILVRQAMAIRSRDSVASWLHGVASRVSTHANVDVARRRQHEQRSAELTPRTRLECADESNCGDDPDNATTVLHEELLRLPDRYREAVVLCYLESLTCAEAARRLRRPEGTIKARLFRARGLLKQRLLRRGVSLPAVLIAMGAKTHAATLVPRELLNVTILSLSQDEPTSARVISLAQGVLGSMLILRIKLVAVCFLAIALAGGTVLVARGVLPAPDEPQTKKTDGPSAAKPPELAVDIPAYRAVRLALKQVLPVATASADPFYATFALIRLAKAQNAAGDLAAALDTFVLADGAAARVRDEGRRSFALMRTAAASGRIGDTARARATLEGLAREAEQREPKARYDRMRQVIEHLFRAGLVEEARAHLKRELAAVDAIADKDLKAGGVSQLLYAQITLGDYEGALGQVARHSGALSNTRPMLIHVITTYPGAGDRRPPREVVLQALKLASEITYRYPRARARGYLAAALARAGDIETALAIARALGTDDGGPSEFPPEQISHRQVSLDVAREDDRPSTLVAIAREQARAGRAADATATLREVVAANDAPGYIKDSRLRIKTEVQGELGDIAGAKASVAAIGNDHLEKSLALAALARSQAKAGDTTAAAGTFREALAAARAIVVRELFVNDDPAANADRAFHAIAIAQAESGDTQGARATVVSHGSDAWKSEVLATIAPILARLGAVDSALATAHSISGPMLAAEAYCSIASIQAKSGDPTAALAWAARLEDPAAKAFALIGITEGLASRQAEKHN